ncbi:hypothetical protein MRB53_015476 [Persea americana]|uniref:Uncharacterized protein n=1 Tax=Persea americana TaxID=3435 RepID=A0ACC2LZC7_PERAE|nr:hypothetical protein MRB53_015476 [Persea americana]
MPRHHCPPLPRSSSSHHSPSSSPSPYSSQRQHLRLTVSPLQPSVSLALPISFTPSPSPSFLPCILVTLHTKLNSIYLDVGEAKNSASMSFHVRAGLFQVVGCFFAFSLSIWLLFFLY